LTGWLCSGWDSSLLEYDCEVFLMNCLLYDFLLKAGGEVSLERRIIYRMVTVIQSEVVCNHMCLCINVLIRRER